MIKLVLKVIHASGEVVAVSEGENEVYLVYDKAYEEGDQIVLVSSQKACHLRVQVDDALGEALIYMTEKEISYKIPFGEKRVSYSPKVFTGERHLLTASIISEREIKNYRNLAINVMDQHGDIGYYPHATANVETRGESVFAARNAIDGVRANTSHGEWPYESWGINRQDDATIKVEFGRVVEVEELVLYTRADFPHDNWWTSITVCLSDGTELEWHLEKSQKPHKMSMEKKQISWILLKELIKSEDPSPFPALTQIEVYGRDL